MFSQRQKGWSFALLAVCSTIGLLASTALAKESKVKLPQFAPVYAEVNETLKELYDGCADRKFCFGSSATESDCEPKQSCDYFVGISLNSGNESTARFQLARRGLGYVAVGLSYDALMGDDNVVACVKPNDILTTNGVIYSLWNVKEGEVRLKGRAEDYDDLSNLQLSFTDSWILCQFDMRLNSTLEGKSFDLEAGKLTILIAKGPVNIGEDRKEKPILQHDDAKAKPLELPGVPGGSQSASAVSSLLQYAFLLLATFAYSTMTSSILF